MAMVFSVMGCAHQTVQPADRPAPQPANQTRDPGRAVRDLQAMAVRQREQPDKTAQELPPPPGVAADEVDRLPPTDLAAGSNAVLSLADVMILFQPAADATPRQREAVVALGPQALRLYVSGRAKLLSGEAGPAVVDLESAARLDPDAPEVWRELGAAQVELSRRTAAVTSLRRAVRLGLNEAWVFVLLGRDAAKLHRFEDAARFQVRALSATHGDTGVFPLTSVDLSESLTALGYLTAARDQLATGLSTPSDTVGQTAMRAELAEVLRKRGEYWQRVGDLSCRLGDYERALAAYTNALRSPMLDPGLVVARSVHAALRAGRTADAALILIGDVDQSNGRVEDRHMAVIAFLAASTNVGPLLSQAISELGAGITSPTATVLSRVARASAAALTGEDARRVLRQRLANAPLDQACLSDLLDSFAVDDADSRIEECLRLVTIEPLGAGAYANSLTRCGRALSESVTSVEKNRSPNARLMECALLTRLGQPQRAIESLNNFTPPAQLLPATLTMRALAAIQCGKVEQARDAEARLAGLPGQSALRGRVAVLAGLEQFDAALELIRPLIENSNLVMNPEDLVHAAELAVHADRSAEAEHFLELAIAADPLDERGYEGLLSLYSPGAALADERKLTSTARSLRQAVASSRVIRAISGQTLVARSIWRQASQEVLALAGSGPADPGLLAMLATVWERAAATDRPLAESGESWLSAYLNSRPDSSAALAARARVLVALGRSQEAADLLSQRLAIWPIDELARQYEQVVRDGLKDPAQADRLARARLESGPRSVDSAIEFADLLFRTGEPAAAFQRLLGSLPPGSHLRSNQTARIVALLNKVKPETYVSGESPESLDAALRLFDLVAGGSAMPAHLHLTRLSLMAAAYPEDLARLFSAIDEAASRSNELKLPAYFRVVETLQSREDPTSMLRFLGASAMRVVPPSEDLYVRWFVWTAERGDVDDARYLVTAIANPAIMLDFVRPLDMEVGEDDPKVQLGYLLANQLSAFGRDELAVPAYRLTLELEPDHAWTCNNLGYLLLEKGGDLAEAESLIERAYAQLPDEISILDSLAWVRYKRGQLKDRLNADGQVTSEGALTLLRRAVDDIGGDINGVILDHFADALWRVGDHVEARRYWAKSIQAFDEYRQLATSQGIKRDTPAMRELSEQLAAVRTKYAAAEKGLEPPIAPLAMEPGGQHPAAQDQAKP